jgi:lipopolysaccharide transport system ATP-binding protein
MSSKDIAITVENISKLYRIGLKENMHDSFGAAIVSFIKSPLSNYRKYRSLYNFDDINRNSDSKSNSNSSDIIWALRDISFEVKQGEVLGIIGSNGAGKSTLLKILCRITDPTTGCAEIRGRISSLLEVGTGFHPELTGRENVYLNGTILGMRKNEVDRKFEEIVNFSGVEKFIDTPVKRYSSGMKVRLAFAVAAHLEPEILIIDEVLAVGDADFQKKCLNKMQEVGQQGRTVLFVSHNMQAVTRLCERAILLYEGGIVKDGPAHKVVSAYLTSDLGVTGAREWPDPEKAPAGPVVRLRAVRVRTEDSKISDSFDIRRPIRIEMEYEVLKSGCVLLPHFGLNNERGQCAFITVDQDPAWRQRARPTGNYVSTVWIPGNLLSEGLMFVSCFFLTLNPDTLQIAERSAVTFHVFDSHDGDSARGDYVKRMRGVVRPLLKWTTQFNSNRANIADMATKNAKL